MTAQIITWRRFLSATKVGLLLLALSIGVCCVNVSHKQPYFHDYDAVKISTIWKGNASIRALYVDPQHIFFAGSDGVFGYLNTADNSVAYRGTITHNGQRPEFRGLATTKNVDLVMSAGHPALIYKVNFFGKRKLLYQQDIKGTFYDAMGFWNAQEGLAIGDPTAGCMGFLTTRDAGANWQPISCDMLPKARTGEAAFAASNSNISMVGDSAWVISGGKTSRVYFTSDKGKTWTIYKTPLCQDKSSTGGYSIDFYNSKTGFIIGGDYTDPENNHRNKALTTDGGKTWHLVADGKDPGYQSCVKFVPGGKGKELVSVGKTGIYYSRDQGKTWTKLSDEKFYTLRFLNESVAYAAGNGKISKLTFLAQ